MPEGQFARFVLLVRAETQEAVLACVHHHMLSDAPFRPAFCSSTVECVRHTVCIAQPEAGYLDYSAYQQWRVRQDDVQAFRISLAARLNQGGTARHCDSAISLAWRIVRLCRAGRIDVGGCRAFDAGMRRTGTDALFSVVYDVRPCITDL